MEKLRRAVNEIAYTCDFSKLSTNKRSLIPLLSLASSLYKLSLSIRYLLYHFGLFHKDRLPLPVISVGNLTWGGNGKTPMVEFLSLWFAHSGISPLILSRGYAGGDEVKMLHRHLVGTTAKIGVGANRAKTAICYLQRYGHVGPGNHYSEEKLGNHFDSGKFGVVVLDDGMQHLSLSRDVEIVMINGLMPWGNRQLLPLGPLRELLTGLQRADVVVVHHADLVPKQNLGDIELMICEIKESIAIFFTRMAPSHFLKVGVTQTRIPLTAVQDKVLLCVSAIGSPIAFVKCIEKLGPLCVDRLDFSDHHLLQDKDIAIIKVKAQELQSRFGLKPTIVVTEKDYDRDPEVLLRLCHFDVLVLCSQLQFVSCEGRSEDSFKKLLRQHLEVKSSSS